MRDFYRIECEETGQGPYQSGEYDSVKTPSSDKHPTPWNEGLWDRSKIWADPDYYDDQQSFVCGFANLSQLTDWFDLASLNNMWASSNRYGRHYNIIRFSVHEEHTRVGKCQAVSRKRFMKEIKRMSLPEFVGHLGDGVSLKELEMIMS